MLIIDTVALKTATQPLMFKTRSNTSLIISKEMDFLNIFFLFFPQTFWEKLAISVNSNLRQYTSSKRNPVMGVSFSDLIAFYGKYTFIVLITINIIGLWLHIENTYGNNVRNLRQHLKDMKKNGIFLKGFGIRRFEQIRHALNPSLFDLNELLSILRTSIQRYDLHLI